MITNKTCIKFATTYDRSDVRHLFKCSNDNLSGVDGVTRKFYNLFISVSNTSFEKKSGGGSIEVRTSYI